MLLTSCETGPLGTSGIESAICDGTAKARDEHVDALLADGGPRSLETGAYFIKLIDTGCGRAL